MLFDINTNYRSFANIVVIIGQSPTNDLFIKLWLDDVLLQK